MKKERLDCPYDFTSRCTMGRCDCKPKEELPIVNGSYGCVIETKKKEVNKMKQTAVEYLIDQLFPKALSAEQYYHIEKAKEMEAEQIENAFDSGWERADEKKHQAYTTLEDRGSNYYKETFKKE